MSEAADGAPPTAAGAALPVAAGRPNGGGGGGNPVRGPRFGGGGSALALRARVGGGGGAPTAFAPALGNADDRSEPGSGAAAGGEEPRVGSLFPGFGLLGSPRGPVRPVYRCRAYCFMASLIR